MNPKVIWYLVRTDWRRLWVVVAASWVLLLFAKLPFIFADFGTMADRAKWMHSGSGMASEGQFNRLVMDSALSRMPGWSDVIEGPAMLYVPMLVLVCALVGIAGGGWSMARPVRKTEWAASKLVQLVLFILLPSALVVGAATLNHGFSAAAALEDSVRSVVLMLPMAVILALTGAMCGTFGRWVGWMAGFALFFTVFRLVLQQDWLDGDALGLWGEGRYFLLRDAGIVILLSVVMLLVKRRRSSWAPAFAWPLILGIALGAKWGDSALGTGRPAGLRELPALEISGDRWKIEDFRKSVQTDGRKSLVTTEWTLPADEAPGQVRTAWWPVGEISASRNGEVVARQPELTFVERMQWRRGDRQSAVESISAVPDELLRGVLPREAGNLISLGQKPPLPGDWLPLGVIGAIKGSGPVSISARLEGMSMKCSLLGELPVGGKLDLRTDTESMRVDATFASGVKVDVARLSRIHGAGKEPLSALAAVLVLPHGAVSIRLAGGEYSYRHGMLGACRFESVTFRMRSDELQRVSRLFGPFGEGEAKVMVFRKEVLDRMTRDARGTDVPVADRQSPERKLPRTLDQGDTREFFMSYPKGRPDPGTCTEQEAGLWIYRILALETRDDAWIAREIAPYAARHAGLFLRLPVAHWMRRGVEGAVMEGLPGSAKTELFEAMAVEPDDRKFQVMFAVAERRGWMNEVRQIVADRISARKPVSEPLAAVAVKYVDPDFYPALLERIAQGATWSLFEKVRHLPGITADLDAAVTRYEQGIRGHRANQIETFMIPASNGSGRALGAILSLINEAAISGKRFDSWPQVLKVARIPVSSAARQRWTVDLEYGGLAADDFTWNPFLRQWVPKKHVTFPKRQ